MRRIFGQAVAVLPVIMLGGLIALAGSASPAAAGTVATVTVNLGTPRVSCAGGQCQYLMNCSVRVTNLTGQDLSLPVSSPVTVLTGSVAWSSPGGSGIVSAGIGVQWPRAVNGYAAIAPGSSITATNCQLFPIIPQEATTAIVIETDPLAPVPSSESWWDVPVSQTSALESTQTAYADYQQHKASQRHYLGH